MIIGNIQIWKFNMKIGLVGEAPNDVKSIRNILEKQYQSSNYEYCFLLERIHGSQLDNQKTKRFLRIEYETKKPDIIIFIRDLDSLLPNQIKYKERQSYYIEANSVVDKKGIFLLNIYEIEALILCDIQCFNKMYNTSIIEINNSMEISEPKEFLKSYSNSYCESDNPDIFSNLNFEKLMKCKFFNTFIKKFIKKCQNTKNNI